MSEPASDQLNSSRGISITISKETTENKAEHCREHIERYSDDGGSARPVRRVAVFSKWLPRIFLVI